MPPYDFAASAYRPMWLFAMFDLPVKTDADRRQYTRFRKLLMREGFFMMQYSVYARYCPNEESAQANRAHVEGSLPPKGQVRVLSVTDRQFGKMEVYFGKKRRPTERPPEQLLLF